MGYVGILEDNKQTNKVAVIERESLREEIRKHKQKLHALIRLEKYLDGLGAWYNLDYLKTLNVKFKIKRRVVKHG